MFDLLTDNGFKIEDIPLAEEGAEGVSALFMDIMTCGSSYATRNSQGPQLVVILVSVRL